MTHECKHTERIDDMHKKIKNIDDKLSKLVSLKNQILGVLYFIGFISPIITSLVIAYFNK